MRTLKPLFEEVELNSINQKEIRSKMINLIKDKLFGYLDEKDLNTILDYVKSSERLDSSRSKLCTELENHSRVVRAQEIEKIANIVLETDKEVSPILREVYKNTTIKSYTDGIIRSIREDKPNKETGK